MFNSVSQDENGLLWIGSNHGLSYYNPGTKQYTPVSNTLINEISSLICVRQGPLWIVTEEKLFAYLIKEKKFILFGETDGVVPNEHLDNEQLGIPFICNKIGISRASLDVYKRQMLLFLVWK